QPTVGPSTRVTDDELPPTASPSARVTEEDSQGDEISPTTCPSTTVTEEDGKGAELPPTASPLTGVTEKERQGSKLPPTALSHTETRCCGDENAEGRFCVVAYFVSLQASAGAGGICLEQGQEFGEEYGKAEIQKRTAGKTHTAGVPWKQRRGNGLA
ncbi:hypothetical protein LSAT2_010779, partial [Lamellibrachia satsuma]